MDLIAATAATVLVSQMVGDGWKETKTRITKLWRDHQPGQAVGIEGNLERLRAGVQTARASRNAQREHEFAQEWAGRLEALFKAAPAAMPELLAALGVPLPPGEQNLHSTGDRNQLVGTNHGSVAGRDIHQIQDNSIGVSPRGSLQPALVFGRGPGVVVALLGILVGVYGFVGSAAAGIHPDNSTFTDITLSNGMPLAAFDLLLGIVGCAITSLGSALALRATAQARRGENGSPAHFGILALTMILLVVGFVEMTHGTPVSTLLPHFSWSSHAK